MLIKPHIFRVRLFDRWWYGYAAAGRQPTLARSVRQLQEWFRDPVKILPKTWSSRYFRWLETPQGNLALVEIDHLDLRCWSSQPGWFWARDSKTFQKVLVRLSKVERGTTFVPSAVAQSDPQQLYLANGSTLETHLPPPSSQQH